MLANIKGTVIAASAAVVIGFGVGYYTTGQFAKAAMHDKVTEARREDAKSVRQGVEASLEVEQKVFESNKHVGEIRKKVVNNVRKKEVVYVEKQVHVPVDVCNLSVGTVRMLNDARGGATAGAAGSVDGAGETTATATVPELPEQQQ